MLELQTAREATAASSGTHSLPCTKEEQHEQEQDIEQGSRTKAAVMERQCDEMQDDQQLAAQDVLT